MGCGTCCSKAARPWPARSSRPRCVDEVVAYLAPKLLGAGPAALGDAGIATIADALALEIEDVSRLGPDVRITARPVWPTTSAATSRGLAMFTGIVEELGEVGALDRARRQRAC